MKTKLLFLTAAVATGFAFAADAKPDTLITWRDGALSVSSAEFAAALDQMPQNQRNDTIADKKRLSALLFDLQLSRTLATDARKKGVDKDPTVRIQLQLAAEKALGQLYAVQFERDLKRPDFAQTAKERYDTSPAAYTVPEQIHAAHVLIKASGDNDEAARKRAEEVRQKAISGADFAQLAKEFSEDPSAARNSGDLGFFAHGRMVKEFDDAAFALTKPGEISPVVKTQFGYHVIRLIERQPAHVKPFEEVRDSIMKQDELDFVRNARRVYLLDIQTDKSSVFNSDALDKFYQAPPKVPAPAANDKH